MALLERLYTAFDAITAAHGLFKARAQLQRALTLAALVALAAAC
jgi:hypothetical protein